MARKYLRPWYVNFQWCTEALTPQGWKAVYCSKTKTKAKRDGIKWSQEMGQKTRVVPGSGHKSRRAA